MKTIKFLSTLSIALFLTAQAYAQDAGKEQLVVPLSEPGKPFKLDVHLVDGGITISGYEGKDIVIETVSNERKRSAESQEHGSGMRKLGSGSNAEIQAEERNNDVTISGNAGRSVNLVIKVPQTESTLKIGTVNNGNIIGSNLSGDLEVTNVNGFIKLKNISGSVVANTVNGNVEVSFKSIDPKAAMAFSTLNGNVDITYPAGLKANVKLKSDRGDVYTDFDVVTDQRKPEVTRSNAKGMYSLKIEDWVYGKIDGGGQQLMMKTTFGNIYIRKAK
ncbi:MAG TPA: hypothetical protein VGM63_10455 [Mucilaginibacter sp.]|jgi:hypothetical protein